MTLLSFKEFCAIERQKPKKAKVIPLDKRPVPNSTASGRPFRHNQSQGTLTEEEIKGQFKSRVVYNKRAKRVTIQRYLISKIAYNPKEATLEDVLVLYDNILWLQDKSARDPQFSSKFGLALEALAAFLKRVRFSRNKLSRTLKIYSQEFKKDSFGLLFPKRNLTSVKINVSKMYRLDYPKPLGRINSTLPPKKYVGKGYDDKGTARDVAQDGSQSWQEIASARLDECQITKRSTLNEEV